MPKERSKKDLPAHHQPFSVVEISSTLSYENIEKLFCQFFNHEVREEKMFDLKIEEGVDMIQFRTKGPMQSGRRKFKVIPREGTFSKASQCRLFAFYKSSLKGTIESANVDELNPQKTNNDIWCTDKDVIKRVGGAHSEVRFVIVNGNKCFISNRKYEVRQSWNFKSEKDKKDYQECVKPDVTARKYQEDFFNQIKTNNDNSNEPNPPSLCGSSQYEELFLQTTNTTTEEEGFALDCTYDLYLDIKKHPKSDHMLPQLEWPFQSESYPYIGASTSCRGTTMSDMPCFVLQQQQQLQPQEPLNLSQLLPYLDFLEQHIQNLKYMVMSMSLSLPKN
nr:unnamed protein product [Naegleria fowleri]